VGKFLDVALRTRPRDSLVATKHEVTTNQGRMSHSPTPVREKPRVVRKKICQAGKLFLIESFNSCGELLALGLNQ
jgi:hypothetical protein